MLLSQIEEKEKESEDLKNEIRLCQRKNEAHTSEVPKYNDPCIHTYVLNFIFASNLIPKKESLVSLETCLSSKYCRHGFYDFESLIMECESMFRARQGSEVYVEGMETARNPRRT